jgi:hypothetical protein
MSATAGRVMHSPYAELPYTAILQRPFSEATGITSRRCARPRLSSGETPPFPGLAFLNCMTGLRQTAEDSPLRPWRAP